MVPIRFNLVGLPRIVSGEPELLGRFPARFSQQLWLPVAIQQQHIFLQQIGAFHAQAGFSLQAEHTCINLVELLENGSQQPDSVQWLPNTSGFQSPFHSKTSLHSSLSLPSHVPVKQRLWGLFDLIY